MLKNWILSKLEAAKSSPSILVTDHLHLLSEKDRLIDDFATRNGYSAIPASTNLVFRDIFERTAASTETGKILVIDRTPKGRLTKPSPNRAPPILYPDFLSEVPEDARIDLNLRQFLREQTKDSNWPNETNEPRYAKLIVKNLDGILRAHENLRNADENRFTDHDFKTIVAFAALGIAEKAFRKLDFSDFWKISLLKHEELAELDYLAPEVTRPILEQFSKAEPPFCWFSDHDAETVVRAFYLSAILAQHVPSWKLLLANIDPSLKPFSEIDVEVLKKAAPKLVELDAEQADLDLAALEDYIDNESLKLLLIDQMKITKPDGFARAIENECYSTLIRSLALLLALEDLLSSKPSLDNHERIRKVLFSVEKSVKYVDSRESDVWFDLLEAYRLAWEILQLRAALFESLRSIRVSKSDTVSFDIFWKLWNEKKVNRLEYYLSSLDRLVFSHEILPRSSDRLPHEFVASLDRIGQRIKELTDKSNELMDEVNRSFQEMVRKQYPTWISKDSEVLLTSQFLRRCLKPNWDPEAKAAVFIFDGMRYDIWDELFRPMLADRMEIITEYYGLSLLPSETQITRKAISAGAYPDEFDTGRAEDRLLKEGLAREFRYGGDVEVLNPEGSGVGETVRYRAGNLDVYIFELCDKELHGVKTKKLPDGRVVSQRPLTLIYQQRLKDVLEHEVMAIVRNLRQDTTVFITADHGFTRVGRQPIWFDEADLNDEFDCNYLNCRLKVSPIFSRIPERVKDNIISFTPAQLRMPNSEDLLDRKTGIKTKKTYEAIAFPGAGYFFSRKGGHYPDAFTHGGISIQEMIVPMVVLRVKSPDTGILKVGEIIGPLETVEGEEIEISLVLSRTDKGRASLQDLRVDIEASYIYDHVRIALPQKVKYLSSLAGDEIKYRLTPELETLPPEDRLKGVIKLTLTVTMSYDESGREKRKSRTHSITIKLNSERIIRRVGNLGSILGLTPKGMR
jgi:hypothetical protein